MYIQRLRFDDSLWIRTKDGDPACQLLFSRHYSKYHYKDGRKPKLFVGPGEKEVLVTADGKAMFVWRKFHSADGQLGINCAIFRNEGNVLSSLLLQEAMDIAQKRWPGERMYTYINKAKIKNLRNPGYCFKVCGWKHIGFTKKNKLMIFEYIK